MAFGKLGARGGFGSLGALGGVGKGIRLSGSSFTVGAAQGTVLGTLSVVGVTGSPTFSLNPADTHLQIVGSSLQVGPTVSSAGSFSVTIHVTGVVPTLTDTPFTIVAWTTVSNTVAPAISGSAVQGATLTVSNGTWTGSPAPTYTYQWKRAGSAIGGATASTYALQAADVGSAITCTVTASNGFSSANVTTSATATVTKTTLTYSPVTTATQGGAYTGATPSTSGGTASYVYSISGTLPTGLVVAPSTGIISGTPTSSAAYSGIVLTVTDANGVTDSSSPFTITVSNVSVDPPVLSLLSTGSDNTPNFNVDLPSGNGAPRDAAAGDVLRVQSQLGAGSWVDYVVHTLTSGDISTDIIGVTSVTPLSDGTYNFQARLERGASVSAWSNTVSETIDTTAPTLSSPTGTKTGSTTATLSVTTNEGNGTLYWVLTASATPPSAAQVKAGQNNGGTAALKAGSAAVVGTGAQPVSVTALTASTTYFTYFMQEDAATNQSSVSAASSFVTDALAAMTLDSSRKGANLTLSNGNLTATIGSNTFYSNVFGNGTARSSGKYYFELTITALSADGQGVGFGNSLATTSEQDGALDNSCAWRFQSGIVLHSGISMGTIQTAAAGDVVAVAIDFDASKIWFRSSSNTKWNNDVIGNQNPVGAVGGFTFSGGGMAAGPYLPMATLEINGDIYTANFGGTSYNGSLGLPSGFSNWT